MCESCEKCDGCLITKLRERAERAERRCAELQGEASTYKAAYKLLQVCSAPDDKRHTIAQLSADLARVVSQNSALVSEKEELRRRAVQSVSDAQNLRCELDRLRSEHTALRALTSASVLRHRCKPPLGNPTREEAIAERDRLRVDAERLDHAYAALTSLRRELDSVIDGITSK